MFESFSDRLIFILHLHVKSWMLKLEFPIIQNINEELLNDCQLGISDVEWTLSLHQVNI